MSNPPFIASSLGAYRILLQARSSRTILVEGRSDKEVLERLRLAFQLNGGEGAKPNNKPVIEFVGQLDDVKFGQLGIRDRALIVSNDVHLPEKLKVLVDREWDDFSIDTGKEFQPSSPFDAAEMCCKTIGHSIENYFFQAECAAALLANNHPHHFDANLRALCTSAADAAKKIAFAYSWSLKQEGLLDVADRLVDWTHMEISDTSFTFDLDKFKAALLGRGVSEAKADAFERGYLEVWERINNQLISDDVCRWLSHGHRGLEVFWCCVAAMGRLHGMSSDDAHQLSRGDHKMRHKACAEVLALGNGLERSPLEQIVNWALNID